MKIGIDIDDVITDTSLSMKDYIIKYDTNGEIVKHIEEVMRGEMPTPSIKQFFDDHNVEIFGNAKQKENANMVINRLLLNNEIFLITSRGEEKYIGSETVTLNYLKSHNINYTKIIFNSFNKAKICKENRIDIMVDDSVKYCEEIRKENIKSIVFTSEVNKNINTNIERVSNWLELEEKINRYG